VGPSFSVGLLPRVDVGFAIQAWIKPPRFWAFEIGGVIWAPVTVGPAAGVGAHLSLAQASLATCPIAGSRRGFHYNACAGFEVGVLTAAGFGFDQPFEEERIVAGATIRGRVRRALVAPLAVSIGMGISAPFVRGRVFYSDSSGVERDIFVASPVAGSADLMLDVDLP
jgi:hypothetical protein